VSQHYNTAMGNEVSGPYGGDIDPRYEELNGAIKRGDLVEVRKLVEEDGLSADGSPGCSSWDHPLLGACMNADHADGSALLIARYLHSKGASGYDVATAVYMGDVDRVKELVMATTEGSNKILSVGSSVTIHGLRSKTGKAHNGKSGMIKTELDDETDRYGVSLEGGKILAVKPGNLTLVAAQPAAGEELDAEKACRLIRTCRHAEMARWLYDHAGEDCDDREDAYHITTACKLGDLERVKALAAMPGFDINTGYLDPMPGCGHDIVPYTTEKDRDAHNNNLKEKYRRTNATHCTKLVYPLQVACLRQRTFNPNMATYLIDKLGADVDFAIDSLKFSQKEKTTILATALDRGYMDVTSFLIDHGATPPWEKDEAAAAQCLMSAAGSDSTETLELLLLSDKERAAKFDLEWKDKFGRTPLRLACSLGREENVALLLKAGAVVSVDDVRAAFAKDANLVKVLIESSDEGSKLLPKSDGEAAATWVDYSLPDDGRALELLKFLRDCGVDVTAVHVAKSDDGKEHQFYALHAAVMRGALSCIAYLLEECGADPDAVGGCPGRRGALLADDWKKNLGLQYGHVYGDGVNLDPDRVRPVRELFERARESKRGGKTEVKRLRRNETKEVSGN